MKLRRILIFLSTLLFVLITWLFFIPRSYDVQAFVKREGTQYWDLRTGSRIGYYKVEAHSVARKYPIIYLHGGPGGRIKNELIEVLRPLAALGHDLYFYDQIGSGHSARLEDIQEYTVQRHVADLKEIIERIGSEKVIIIAHSWGCMLAANYLQDQPNRVAKMVLEGPGPILPIRRSLMELSPPDSLQLRKPEFTNAEGNRKANNWRTWLIRKWAYRTHKKLASDQEADDFFTYLNQELSKSTYCQYDQEIPVEGGGGYYAHIMTVKSFDQVEDKREQLAKIDLPVLLLKGQCDNQAWGFTQEYLELFPNSQLMLMENAGHNLIRESEGKYYTLISDFVLREGDVAK